MATRFLAAIVCAALLAGCGSRSAPAQNEQTDAAAITDSCEDAGALALAAEIQRDGSGLGKWVASEFEVWRPFRDTARIWIANGKSGVGVALGTGEYSTSSAPLSGPDEGGYSAGCKALLWAAAEPVIEWSQANSRENVRSAVAGK